METKILYNNKNKLLFLLAIFIFLLGLQKQVDGQAATANWPLTLWEAPEVTGNITASNLFGGPGISAVAYWTAGGAYSTGWNSSSKNTSDYYEYSVTPASGLSLTISQVNLSPSTNNGSMIAAVYYSTDGFATSMLLRDNIAVSTTVQTVVINGLSIIVSNGKTFAVRIYGWGAGSSMDQFRNKDVQIFGSTTCGAISVTAQASKSAICQGESINLTSTKTGGSGTTILLSENFNSGTNVFTATNKSTGGVVEEVAWSLRPDNYYYYFNFHSNDNSQFYLSNSHAQGPSSITSTILQSPAINTVGLGTLAMDFYHYFDPFGGEKGQVQVSVDNSTWKDLAVFTTPQGSANSFAHYVVNLDAYVGKANIWIRFKFDGSWGWWWAIDNVTVGNLSDDYTIEWQSDVSGFTSTEQNPNGVVPLQTTTYTAEYKSKSGCASSASATVTVSPPLAAPIANAEQSFCSGATIADLQVTVPMGSSVRWFATAVGGTPFAASEALSSATYYAESYNGTSDCSSGNRTAVAVVNGAPPAQPGAISGLIAVCPATSQTYSVPDVPGITYSWAFPIGWTQTGGGNSNSVTVTAGTTAGNITVTPSNGCGNGTPMSLSVTIASASAPTITISADQNPACPNETVLFSSAVTNGGSIPSYQWKVDDIDVTGETNSTFSYKPKSGETITCLVISSEACSNPSSAISNRIVMDLKPSFTPLISISADKNPICSGPAATFSAVVTNAGVSPIYQWKVNGNNVGTSSSTYIYPPQDGDVVTCVVTSTEVCANPSSVTSNSVVMAVSTALVPEILISADQSPVCPNQTVNFTSTATNAGSNPDYQWRVNGSDVLGANAVSYAYIPNEGDIITCRLTSKDICANPTFDISNDIIIVFSANLTPEISISANKNPICLGDEVIFSSSQTNGGSTPLYQWKVNGADRVGENKGSFKYVPSEGDVVTCELVSNLACVTSARAVSNPLAIIMNKVFVPVINIYADKNVVCSGAQVNYTSSVNDGGLSPAYQWQVNNANILGATSPTLTYAPKQGDVVSCKFTSSNACAVPLVANSNNISVVVNPSAAPTIGIVADQNFVCPSTTVNYTSTITNGGISPSYQWKVNNVAIAGQTGANYSYIPQNGDIITCELISNANCATAAVVTSNAIQMTLGAPVTPVINISANQNPVCAGSMATFTSEIFYGGLSPVYQWKVNGLNRSGENKNNFTYLPSAGDVVTCEMTSSLSCTVTSTASSNAVAISLTPQSTPTISITADQTNLCGGGTVNFSSVITNGGVAPIYQWQVDGKDIPLAMSNTFSYKPLKSETVSCKLISNAACVTTPFVSSNNIPITVNSLLTADIKIVADQNYGCAGSTINYSTTVKNGGALPKYQWKVNNVAIAGQTGANYSFVPVDGDVITCELVSNSPCVTPSTAVSNSITMVLGPPVDPFISINPSENPVCPGNSVTFTSESKYGGLTPDYQWKVDGVPRPGEKASSFTYIPQDGDVVTCEFTTSLDCAVKYTVESNPVTMLLDANLVPTIAILTDQTNVCVGSLVHFSSKIEHGGVSPAYQWQVDGADYPGATNPEFDYVSMGDVIVTCVLTSSNACVATPTVTSNGIGINIITDVVPTISITEDKNNICEGTEVNYSSIVKNGGTAPSYQWIKNGAPIMGENGNSYSYAPLDGDEITCIVASSLACSDPTYIASNKITMDVSQSVAPSVSISASQNPICAGTQVVFTARAVGGGTLPQYQWRVNGTVQIGETTEIFKSSSLTSGDVIGCRLISNALCATTNVVSSNDIEIAVSSVITPSIIISSSLNPVCAGTSVTYSANITNGGMAPLYQWKVNGAAIPNATNSNFSYAPNDGDLISCDLISDLPCAGNSAVTSNIVVARHKPSFEPEIKISANQNPICKGSKITFLSTATNAGSKPLYQWKINGVNISGATNSTYSYIPLIEGDIVSCELTSVESCASPKSVVSNTVTIGFRPEVEPLITISADNNPMCSGVAVNFTANVTNAGVNPLYQWRINQEIKPLTTLSTYSYMPVSGDVVSCELISSDACAGLSVASSNKIVFNLNPSVNPTVTVSAVYDPGCPRGEAQFRALATNGGNAPQYKWLVNGSIRQAGVSDIFTYIPNDKDIVACELTSSALCAIPAVVVSNNLSLTVRDDESPTITCPPNLVDIPTDLDQCYSTIALLGDPVVLDNCGVASVVNDAPLQFPIGTTKVVWTATDYAGNMATCEQFVTVVDVQPPTIICPAELFGVIVDDGKNYATIDDLGNIEATDNCSGFVATNNAPKTFPVGETLVEWKVADKAGNITTCKQLITVVFPLVAVAGSDKIIGSCQTLQLDGTKSTGEITNYSWSVLTSGGKLTGFNSTRPQFALESGFNGQLPAKFDIELKLTDKYGQTAVDHLVVTVDKAPVAMIEPPGIPDLYGHLQLNGSHSSGTELRYKWTTTDGKFEGVSDAPIVTATRTGTYVLEAKDVYGCSSTTSLYAVIEEPFMVAYDDYARTSWVDTVRVDILANDYDSYNGIYPATLSIIDKPKLGYTSVSADGTLLYTPTTTTPGRDRLVYKICNYANLCDTAVVTIDIFDVYFRIPEGLTPNGDGLNDLFVIDGLEHYPKSKLVIFSRSGQMVFGSEDYQNDWDGRSYLKSVSENNIVPQGVYYYILSFGGTDRKLKGFIYVAY